MRKINTKTKTSIMSLFIFGILIIGIFATSIYASTNYQLTLIKGTDDLIVNQYNDAAWKSTVNSSTDPSHWFEGDTNITGAKSRTTLLGWNYITWEAYDILTSLFMTEYFSVEEIVILLNIMNSEGFNETTINENYTNTYNLWYGIRAVWNFTKGPLEEHPSYNEGVLVFKNPLGVKTILDDYNTIAAELNGNLVIQLSGFTFPNVTADQFLWQLALNGLAIPAPRAQFLIELINELGCENASSSGNSLIFERSGESNYTVEISYGEKGIMASFTVKDISETTIFQLINMNSDWIFYLILLIIIACIAGLVVYVIVTKRKPKK
ncbi:MAG: hypothetical protein ACFFE4_03115 [Candidatus Thorarchaeota archaeon]